MKPKAASSSAISSSENQSLHQIKYRKRKIIRSYRNGTKSNRRGQKTDKTYSRADCYKFEEKKQFIEALLKVIEEENYFFWNEEESLHKFAEKIKDKWSPPTSRSSIDIMHFIKHFMRRIYGHRLRNDKPIDKWCDMVSALTPEDNNLAAQITSAVLVATEEPIPKPEESTTKKKLTGDPAMPEPDYVALYKYLAASVSGSTLPELSPIDSLLIEDCMQSLAEQIKFLDDGDLRLGLRRVFLYLSKTDKHQPEDAEEETIAQLSKGTIFNPLGLNENLITPVPPN